MTSSAHEHVFTRHADVRTALADPHLVPSPARSGPVGSMAWLRDTVARFSTGDTHARRRALLEADLARLDPSALRQAARSGPAGEARVIVVRTLAESLGLSDPDAIAAAITVVAGAYFGDGGEDRADADAAVAWLLPRVLAVDPVDPEAAASRIGLLVQACDATGSLVDHARRAADDCPVAPSTEALLAETLRYDPPVRTMHRIAVRHTRVAGVAIAEGDLVTLDIAAANQDPDVYENPSTFDPERSGPPPLTFGSEPRICPGKNHALALAAGILDRAPAEIVEAMVRHVLTLADTWTAWDGRPAPADDRIYTPHKAIRRVADHLVDHLAEMEARLAGQEPQPDHWHASQITTKADLAPFTQADLDEAHSRLSRLAQIWSNRLNALTPDQLDHSPGPGWSFRKLALHLAGSVYYADAIGSLAPTERRTP
ncbi:cytochrome P450 [Streptomyces sp. NBC_01262]|uniref:cytochrome P450 n=1 Tax=Streptomyces sp. NBC_01262 TaxID=2903803 RepID=UPI002E3047ED|nr:cytochrome P450 [Streptomyces sp. NBC_01262]